MKGIWISPMVLCLGAQERPSSSEPPRTLWVFFLTIDLGSLGFVRFLGFFLKGLWVPKPQSVAGGLFR